MTLAKIQRQRLERCRGGTTLVSCVVFAVATPLDSADNHARRAPPRPHGRDPPGMPSAVAYPSSRPVGLGRRWSRNHSPGKPELRGLHESRLCSFL